MKKILFFVMVVGAWLPSMHAMKQHHLYVMYLATNPPMHWLAILPYSDKQTVDDLGKTIQSQIVELEKTYNKLDIKQMILQCRMDTVNSDQKILKLQAGFTNLLIKEFGSFMSLSSEASQIPNWGPINTINGSLCLSTLLKDSGLLDKFTTQEQPPVGSIIDLIILLEQQKEKQETSVAQQ